MRWIAVALALMAASCALAAIPREMERPPLPALTDPHVNDHAGFLTPADKNALRVRLRALAADGGLNVIVVTVPWVEQEPERAAAWAKHLYEGWATQPERRARGLLVLVARQPCVVELHGGQAAHQPVLDFGDELVNGGEAAVEGAAPSGPLRAALEGFVGHPNAQPWFRQPEVVWGGGAAVLVVTLGLAAVAFLGVSPGRALWVVVPLLLLGAAVAVLSYSDGDPVLAAQEALDNLSPAGCLVLLAVVGLVQLFLPRRRSGLLRLLTGP